MKRAMDVNPGASTDAAVASVPHSPDHQTFLRHIEDAPFQIGLDRGKWRLLASPAWPVALIGISAPARTNSPDEWAFRFDLSLYPHQPPTAGLWDMATQSWLPPERWPKGDGRFALAFSSNWNLHAVYIPCDRSALAGHDGWIAQHPHLIWTPEKDITFYLDILYDYFHSRFYQGTRAA